METSFIFICVHRLLEQHFQVIEIVCPELSLLSLEKPMHLRCFTIRSSLTSLRSRSFEVTGAFLKFSHGLLTVATAAGILIACVIEIGVCTKP